jgi:hypothetical protein
MAFDNCMAPEGAVSVGDDSRKPRPSGRGGRLEGIVSAVGTTDHEPNRPA